MPVIGYVIKKLYIPVKRKSKEDRAKSMDKMVRSLRDGISVYIYPEGTRNKSKQALADFYDGAFRLAIEAQVPLAVCTLIGSDKLLSPLGNMNLMPGTIHAYWHQPIVTKGLSSADVENLKQQTKDIMLQNISRYKNA